MEDIIVLFIVKHLLALVLGWRLYEAAINGLIEPDKADSKFYWWFYGATHALASPTTIKLWKRVIFLKEIIELNGIDVSEEKYTKRADGAARP